MRFPVLWRVGIACVREAFCIIKFSPLYDVRGSSFHTLDGGKSMCEESFLFDEIQPTERGSAFPVLREYYTQGKLFV